MTDHHPHIPLRRLAALAGLAAALAVPSTALAAKAPTVRVAVGAERITVAGADHLRAGAVRLQLSGDGIDGPRSVAVIELERGVSRADVAAADLAGLDDAAQAERFGRLVAGGTVTPTRGYTTTVVARGRRHVVVDVSSADGPSAAFRVAKSRSGAGVPRSDASVTLRDDGLALPRVLPSTGVLRIANRGTGAHQLTLFRIRRGMNGAEAIAAARSGRLGRLGRATELAGLVSAGTVNRVEVDLDRGRYLAASLYSPLTATGRPDILRGLIAPTRVR